MRIQAQEITPGCGEWCACLFDRFGQPIHSEKSVVSENDALERLEDELKRCVNVVYGSSGCAGSVGISPSVPRAFTAPASKLGMTFDRAKRFEMPFGKHKGRTLDDIALDGDGLRYLDWLRGVREDEGKNMDVDKALEVYLNDPSIQSELEN
jgi:hypothetical protein